MESWKSQPYALGTGSIDVQRIAFFGRYPCLSGLFAKWSLSSSHGLSTGRGISRIAYILVNLTVTGLSALAWERPIASVLFCWAIFAFPKF